MTRTQAVTVIAIVAAIFVWVHFAPKQTPIPTTDDAVVQPLPDAGWVFSQNKDPMSDKVSARAFLHGEGGQIGIKCDEAGPDSVYIHFISEQYLGGEGIDSADRTMKIRFDDKPPYEPMWSYKDESAILTANDPVQTFMMGLVRSKRLALRATRYDYDYVDASFNTAGAREAAIKVYKACDDSLAWLR